MPKRKSTLDGSLASVTTQDDDDIDDLDYNSDESNKEIIQEITIKSNSTKSLPWWRWSILMITSMLVALLSATPNAFNPLSIDIEKDTGISSTLMTLLSSLGLTGIFFTLPVGILNDRAGPFITALLGGILATAGYFAMSFTGKDTYWAMVLSFTVVGFGCGAGSISALSTAVMANPTNPGFGIAPVGACLSLSLAFTNELIIVYSKAFNCSSHSCWPQYLRILAITSAVFIILPSGGMCFLPRGKRASEDVYSSDEDEEKPLMEKTFYERSLLKQTEDEDENENDISYIPSSLSFSPPSLLTKQKSIHEISHAKLKKAESTKPVSILFSLNALRNIFFWILIYTYFAGIGSGLVIITGVTQLWEDYSRKSVYSWAPQLATAFSIVNTIFNIISGWGCEMLWKKYKFPRQRVLSIVLCYTCAVFLALFVLTSVGNAGLSTEIIYAGLLVLIGAGFGCYFSILPIIIGDFYGGVNFGLYFSYLQIGSTAATFIIPNAVDGIHTFFGNYIVVFSLMAFIAGSAAIGIWFKQPTPIGRRW